MFEKIYCQKTAILPFQGKFGEDASDYARLYLGIHTNLNIIERKKQAALMAPTDLLSVQHYKYMKKIFHKINIKFGLLTGK